MTTAKSVNGRLKPYLDQQSTNMLNLTVLQRGDPFIQEILITISHVTLYEFNIELNQWSRKDVEGSLFVVRRNAQPQFQFVVMNRLNSGNFVEDLVEDFEYEVQIPYLLYRNAEQKINGIWFYVTYDCEEVSNLFSRILGAQSKLSPKSQVTSRQSKMRGLEKLPTSAVIVGPLEPEATAKRSRDRPVDSSLVNSRPANLVKPSCFEGAGATPGMIETPQASSLISLVDYTCNPLMIPHHQLQPFQPPTHPQLFTPHQNPTSNYGQLNRERVHYALQTLVQDDKFIDMVYKALMKTHQS